MTSRLPVAPTMPASFTFPMFPKSTVSTFSASLRSPACTELALARSPPSWPSGGHRLLCDCRHDWRLLGALGLRFHVGRHGRSYNGRSGDQIGGRLRYRHFAFRWHDSGDRDNRHCGGLGSRDDRSRLGRSCNRSRRISRPGRFTADGPGTSGSPAARTQLGRLFRLSCNTGCPAGPNQPRPLLTVFRFRAAG